MRKHSANHNDFANSCSKSYKKSTKLLASLMMIPLAFLGTPTSAFAAMAGNIPQEENTTAIKDNNQTTDSSSTTNTGKNTDNSTAKHDTIAALSSQQKSELAQFEPNAAGNAITGNDTSVTQQSIREELASDNNDVVLTTEVIDASNFGTDDTKLVEAPEIGSDTLFLLSASSNNSTNTSNNTDEQENNNDNSSSENNNGTEDSGNTGDFFSNIQSSIANFASSITGTPVMQASSSQQAEADGTKIEKITVKWVTKDDYTDGDDARLSQRWTDDNGTITITPKYDNGTVAISTTTATFTNSMKLGTLRITKSVKNSTDASKATNFDFVLNITDDNSTPLSGEYAWSRSDGMTGTVRYGDSVQLHDGQYVDIVLPAGTKYSVIEKECSGYTLIEKNGDTGTITANEKSEASFVNEYNASGVTSLRVDKIAAGFNLADKQFTFKAIPSSDDLGNSLTTLGDLSAYNDANGLVLFDSLLFTEADDGKTFTYDIIEYDDEQSNIAYDTSTIKAKISVRDAGDGTMITSVAYTKNDSNIDNPSFTNKKSVTMPVTGSSALLILLLFGVSVCVASGVKIARREKE